MLGRRNRIRFLHIGRRMSRISTERINPAPLDIHTEKVSVFKPANLGSAACFHHPSAKIPQWKPQNST